MTKFFRDFARNESGAAAAEYVLILAIIGAGVAGGALYLGTAISGALSDKGDYLSECAADVSGEACKG